MTTDSTIEESFVTKLYPDGEPDHSWPAEALGQYAHDRHEAILLGERSTTDDYWALGQAAELLCKQIGRRPASKYLVELGIHKVRLSKANSIFRAFSATAALVGMGVEEAYEASKASRGRRAGGRKQRAAEARGRPGEQNDDADPRKLSVDDLVAFLMEVPARVEPLIDAAAFMAHEQRQALFPLYRAAMVRLQVLGRMLGAEEDGLCSAQPARAPLAEGVAQPEVLGPTAAAGQDCETESQGGDA